MGNLALIIHIRNRKDLPIFIEKQGRKRLLDTPGRKIYIEREIEKREREREERDREREREIEREKIERKRRFLL